MLVVNFYMASMRIPVADIKGILILFREVRYKSVLETAFNLTASLLLAQRFGTAGILAGTLISMLTFPFWCEPWGCCIATACACRSGGIL
ncbi:MAG: hypothetical protein K2P33_01285 [Acutalibacter sp.]|nr:hypothetical protein [Acutalibacter sp.]